MNFYSNQVNNSIYISSIVIMGREFSTNYQEASNATLDCFANPLLIPFLLLLALVLNISGGVEEVEHPVVVDSPSSGGKCTVSIQKRLRRHLNARSKPS